MINYYAFTITITIIPWPIMGKIVFILEEFVYKSVFKLQFI